MIGRESEFQTAAALLASAADAGMARSLRITGPAGIGKTAFASELLTTAEAGGWLVASVSCHQIQSNLPFFVARRLIRTLVEALGDDADHYVSSLPIDKEKPEEFEEAFLRVIEGVSLDHRTAIGLDDAQWADAESCALITRTFSSFADRPLFFVSTERMNEALPSPVELQDAAIVLTSLSDTAARTIVSDIYPSARDDVANAIVESSHGNAMDLVAIASAARDDRTASPDQVVASTRRVVAKEIALLNPQTRTLLQLCSLIDEPIDIKLLQSIIAREELLETLQRVSGRYLLESGGELRFVHSLIMHAIRETIALEIPFRQRIIEALRGLQSPRIEDLQRLCDQAAAVGDKWLERATLLKIADAAAEQSFLALAAATTERALELEPASPAEIAPFYARLSQLYNVAGRESDAIRISREGLECAHAAGLSKGVGAIAASLVIALWLSGDRVAAEATLAEYMSSATDPGDRAQLITTAEFMCAQVADSQRALNLAAELEKVGRDSHPMVMLRHHTMRAIIYLRDGHEEQALRDTQLAERIAEKLPAFFGAMPRTARAVHALCYAGVRSTEVLLAEWDMPAHDPVSNVMLAMAMLARGNAEDVCEFVAERLPQTRDKYLTRTLLSAAAVALAVREVNDRKNISDHIDAAANLFLSGDRSRSLVPLATAWLAMQNGKSDKPLKLILERLIEQYRHPMEFMTFSYPVLLARAASALGATDALRVIASGTDLWCDQSPWHKAQHLLAVGAAEKALGSSTAPGHLLTAKLEFQRLDAPLFETLASQLIGDVKNVNAPKQTTTRREREIASLVAEGLTNRAIAEKLVLSERTVEGHIANLFAKVNVNSRTQLAGWYLREASLAASLL